jgi:hypothetical protein
LNGGLALNDITVYPTTAVTTRYVCLPVAWSRELVPMGPQTYNLQMRLGTDIQSGAVAGGVLSFCARVYPM